VTTEPLLTISTFARAVELPASALRYYDEAGLLTPAEVDPHTGYRYYTPELERRAHLIRRMREIGVPVETMRLALDGPAERSAEILRGFVDALARQARRADAAVEEIVTSLHGAEQAPAPVSVTVDGAELATAVRRVAQAASTEAGSALSGVLLDIAGGTLTAVATDRYWLASWIVPLATAPAATRRVFLPADGTAALTSWLARHGPVILSTDAGGLRVAADDQTRTFPVGQDRFPAYQLIDAALPDPLGRVSVSRDRLARLLAFDDAPVRLVAGTDRVLVSRAGDSEAVRLEAVTHGPPLTVWFAGRRLAKALEVMVGSEVTFIHAGPDRPVRITSAEQLRLSALVMPSTPDR
jgi:DNA-binding transcriptional MerR regulator